MHRGGKARLSRFACADQKLMYHNVSVSPTLAMTRTGSGSLSAAGIQRFLGLLFLNLFFLTAWLASIAPFIGMTISAPLGDVVGLYGLLIYPVLLLVSLGFLEAGRTDRYRDQGYTLLLGATILFLAAYGIVRGNASRNVVFDTIAFSTVFGGYVLGRRDSIWRGIRPMIAILLAISVTCAFVFTSPVVLIDRSILVTQPGSFFEALLVLAPLFGIVAAFERKRGWFYVFLALSIGSFMVYLYFGRRGITIRAGLEIFTILFIIPAILKQFKSIVRSTIVAVGLVTALLLYFPFATLVARYVGEVGFTETVTKRNERWIEAGELVSQMSAAELLVGRGMGGTYSVSANLVEPIFDEVEEGVFGRSSAHANAANIFLKGGLAFVLLCYIPILKLLLKVRMRPAGDYITLAVALSALIALPFQSLEGTITWGSPWVGFAFGLLMSRSHNVASQRTLRRFHPRPNEVMA